MTEMFPPPQPGRFETFLNDEGVEIPLGDASIDEQWVDDLNLWLDEERVDGRTYKMKLRTKTWFEPSTDALGAEVEPLFRRRSMNDPEESYFIEGTTEMAGIMVVKEAGIRKVPGLFLIEARLSHNSRMQWSKDLGGLVAISLEEAPGVLKLIQNREELQL